MNHRHVIIAVIIIVLVLGALVGKITSAKFSQAPNVTTLKSEDNTEVDTQNNTIVEVIYRPELSSQVITFDVDIKSEQTSLSSYDYKNNLVLADGDINPLPHQDITASISNDHHLNIRFTAPKFTGNHFHFLVRNLNGINDRVLHFYKTL